MSTRAARVIPWSIWALCLALVALTGLLRYLTPALPERFEGYWMFPTLGFFPALVMLVYPTVGALIASRRPRNPIGWLLCLVGFVVIVLSFATAYATYAVYAPSSPALPATQYVAWLADRDTLSTRNYAASLSELYSPDKAARVWKVTTGRQIARIEHKDIVVDVAFDPDGNYLATASGDAARVWEASYGKEVAHVNHNGSVGQVAFSPDGEYLATVGEDNVRVWEATTGMEVARMADGGASTVTFDPDGEYLATAAGRAVRVWDASSGKEIVSMTHEDAVTDVAFNPNGEYLVTSSSDTTARAWEVSSGKEVARIDSEGAVSDVAYGLQGKYLATASSDGSARVWYWRPKDLIEEACARLSRNLGQEEWELYLPGEPYRKTCQTLAELS